MLLRDDGTFYRLEKHVSNIVAIGPGTEEWAGCPDLATSLPFHGCTVVWFPKELLLYC